MHRVETKRNKCHSGGNDHKIGNNKNEIKLTFVFASFSDQFVSPLF